MSGDFHVVDSSIVLGDKSLHNDTKLLSLLSNYFKVSIRENNNYKTFSDQLCWCFEKCEGKFRDIPNMRYNKRDWYFEKENDALIFALKWSDQ
jgi:hypothetical protein